MPEPVKKQPAHLDPAERLRTAHHEMSHAIVSYALRCSDITVKVFKRPRPHPAYPKNKILGICSQRLLKPQYRLFITCGPFVSTSYSVDNGDEIEFKDMIRDFIVITGKSEASFRHFVLDPVQNLLDSTPVLEIIKRLAVPMAKGGVLNCKKHTDMEKFFPRTISYPLLQALCRDVKEAADELPVRKATRQNA